MDSGIPCSRYTVSRNKKAAFLPETLVLHDAKFTILLSLSTKMTRPVLPLWSGGMPNIKSKLTDF